MPPDPLPASWLWGGLGMALVWLSVGYQMALCGFGWLCRLQRGFGQVAHIFLALGPRLSALGFGKPFIFRVFGAFRGLTCRF